MKPRKVVYAEALPRNPVGKVLRRVLREPYWQREEQNI
jgi:acyl-coenzyme A synthetase/AMP-(fatty) acid ligase